jgi:hypothetical protein
MNDTDASPVLGAELIPDPDTGKGRLFYAGQLTPPGTPATLPSRLAGILIGP